MDEEITLVQIGKSRVDDKKSNIFAEKKDASLAEHMAAGQMGLKKIVKFLIWAFEYDGQEELIYKGKRMKIYRTYEVGNDLMELYAGERSGIHGN